MEQSILEKTRRLRDEAWSEVQATVEYAGFKALDDAVLRMGGASVDLSPPTPQHFADLMKRTVETAARRMSEGKRIPHGDAAEVALREKREPLPVGLLMEAAIERGAEIGGNDPLSNFRSTVSKDNRFRSVKRNNMYFWWLTDEPVPATWIETSGPDLLDQPDASSLSSSREGGGDHAAKAH